MNNQWKIKLFLVSNVPIFLMILIMKFSIPELSQDNWWLLIKQDILVYISLTSVIFSLVVLYQLVQKLNLSENNTRKKVEVESINESYLITLTAYLLPLVSLLTQGIRSGLVFIFAMLIILLLFMKSDSYYSSFAFFLLGYNIYSSSAAEERFILLSKKPMHELNHKDLKVRYFDNYKNKNAVTKILIEKGVVDES